MRKLDTISFDKSIKITGGIKEKAGLVDVTIPKDLPQVKDGSLWYLRIDTSLSTAPQASFFPLHFGSFLRGWDYVLPGGVYLGFLFDSRG